jgi:hypothetical protein
MNATILSKDTHVFAINTIRKSENWGRSWSQWRKVNTPEVHIPFYSNAAKKRTVTIYSGDVKVNSLEVTADRGFSEVVSDVSFSKKGLKRYQTAYKDFELKESKNCVFCLPKGKYTVKIGDFESTFEVK